MTGENKALLADWPTPIAIAHRGSRYLWPENTMVAFQGAVDLGYGFLETDLHSTSDGVLVCIHDPTVDRTTDGTGQVSLMPFAQLRGYDAGATHRIGDDHPFRGKGISIPSFEELVVTFPDLRFVVDLKSEGLAAPLAGLINRLSLANRIIVGSFSDSRIAEFTEITAGSVATSTGPAMTRSWLITSRLGRGFPGTASALQVPVQMRGVRVVDKRLVDTAKSKGLRVHVWTVNTTEEMEELLDMGVDGLVTDRPDLLKGVMQRRGEWM